MALPAVVTTYGIPDADRSRSEAAGSATLTALLWERKSLVAFVAACGLLAGLGISLLMAPVYRARTSLQVEDFNQTLRDIAPVSPLSNASPEDYLQNEVKVLESDTLARRVSQKLGPLPDKPGELHQLLSAVKKPFASFLPASAPPDPTSLADQRAAAIQKALTIRTGLQSQVVEVFFDAPTPALAAAGANDAAYEFMDLNRDAREQLVQETTAWLNNQAVQLKSKLQSLNSQLQNFTVRSGLILTGNQDTPTEDRVRQLQDALTRAEADRATKQSRFEAAAANPEGVESDALNNSPIRQYETDLQTMRRQLADLKSIYTPENYRVTRLQAQIAETEAAIQKERTAILERMRSDYLASVSLEKMLSKSVAGEVATAQDQTKKQLQYNVLKDEVDTTQKLYDSVLERAKAAGAASSLQITNIRVIDPATPPQHPYSPNVPLNMALGLALGVFGGVGLALMSTRAGKIAQPGELTSMYVPELGVVPSAAGRLAPVVEDRAALVKSDHFDSFLLRESFRAVLASILLSTRLKRSGKQNASTGRVVVVTSVDMMEGKTTIVSNLGVASAQQKCDVLLIDADLRRPSLHQRFGLSNHSGLTDLLKHPELLDLIDGSRESLVQATGTPHLWVLAAGPTDGGSAANLLYSSDLDTVVQGLAKRFDLIFIDTPPMSIYADSRVLGHAGDGVVLVVRANTKSREEIGAAYQKLLQDRVRVLGMVLNDWKFDKGKARAYSRYYSHYEQADTSPA